MNRTGIGLAVGAGYLLGRTKKLKLAFAVGSLVAGKKLNLSPRMVGELLNQQLKNNPQFKEIGDQLRQDLRGVGKAASGAMVERQMNALADRLHGRTSKVRDQLSGVAPETGGEGEAEGEPEGEYEDEYEDREGREAAQESEEPEEPEEPEEEHEEAPAKKAAAKKTTAQKAAKKAPARKAPAKKAAAKKAPAKKTAAKKTAAKKTAAAGSATRSRRQKGGGDR
ncbi:DNA primase [Streptomyces sp. NPDC014864]|uniref:DNA primase n=1 Tax=Streptomyces sp. NPDC014864 TaxID=3364924 RepID=UPI0036F65ED2